MSRAGFRSAIQDILSPAGIELDGSRPWDLQVTDDRFYHRVISDGSLGFGEAFMDGWWECERLDEFFARIMPSRPEVKIRKAWRILLQTLGAALLNPTRKAVAFRVGERHYDIGNTLFQNMLDKRMVYSCAYWKGADTLEAAQEAKLDLICRKLGLQPGERVLDIGCGWGSFGRFAAERYGVEVVGITVSKEQASLAREMCQGLPVEIRLQDYRAVDERFDHVVSVGMFEHVGRKCYRTFMEQVNQCLKDDGLFLLHTIGHDLSLTTLDPWFEKYIFPNSLIPSLKQITSAAERSFVVEDLHNIGFHYDATLCAWFANFHANWHHLRELYDQRFYRMWKYYLLSSAGTCRARRLQVWQLVFSKQGVPGGYDPLCT